MSNSATDDIINDMNSHRAWHNTTRQRESQRSRTQEPFSVRRLQDIDDRLCQLAAAAVIKVEFRARPVVPFKKWLSVNSFYGRVLLIERVDDLTYKVYFERSTAAEQYRRFLNGARYLPGLHFAVDCCRTRHHPLCTIPGYITRVLVIEADKSDQPLSPWSDLLSEIYRRFPALNKECSLAPLWTDESWETYRSIPAGEQGRLARRAFRCGAQRALLIFHSVADAVTVERAFNSCSPSDRLKWPRATGIHCDYGLDVSDVNENRLPIDLVPAYLPVPAYRPRLAALLAQGLELLLALRYARMEAGEYRTTM